MVPLLRRIRNRKRASERGREWGQDRKEKKETE